MYSWSLRVSLLLFHPSALPLRQDQSVGECLQSNCEQHLPTDVSSPSRYSILCGILYPVHQHVCPLCRVAILQLNLLMLLGNLQQGYLHGGIGILIDSSDFPLLRGVIFCFLRSIVWKYHIRSDDRYFRRIERQRE